MRCNFSCIPVRKFLKAQNTHIVSSTNKTEGQDDTLVNFAGEEVLHKKRNTFISFSRYYEPIPLD